MADALLGAASEALLGVVLKKIQDEFANLSGFKGKIEKLSRDLHVIRAVLDDAEVKQISEKPVKIWLQELRDAVYVLDDILDEYSFRFQDDECSMKVIGLGCLSSLKHKNFMFRHAFGRKLKQMITRLDQIAQDKNKYALSATSGRERISEVPEWCETGTLITQPKVHGREKDKKKVINFLLDSAQVSDSLSVYPIVGLGGVGKTTLVQLIYNDEQITTHFNLKIWICVSENFTVKRILCSIVDFITNEKCGELTLAILEQKVQALLRGKRYLLVLDDVWKQDQGFEIGLSLDKWNKLKSVLSCGSTGASILVTTRDKNVAEIMGTCEAHELDVLSEDACWSLFKQCAFGSDNERCQNFEAIGRQIVSKCGGLPLAAQALGGVLRSMNTEKEWVEIKESNLWNLSDENGIMPALRLSYFHLTPTLKLCFAFCAIFPKSTEIMKEELIHLWMANEFISSTKKSEVEDVGNRIWNELWQKSFFQNIKNDDETGEIISFKMHDLIHDLAQSVSGQECVILDDAKVTDLSKSTHHVGFGMDGGPGSFTKSYFEKVKSLRTAYQLDLYKEISCCIASNESLRVLRAWNWFPLASIGNLIHLRYLELKGYDDIKRIPDSICRLRKLQVLKLIRFDGVRCLPKHLARLQNLRHLVIERCDSMSEMFPNIGRLRFLRTLPLFIVKNETGHRLTELRDLNLGGRLTIKGLANVGSLSETKEANLKGKTDLRGLFLYWDDPDPVNAEQVLEGLQPHSNLKLLRIVGYDGLQLPNWLGDSAALSNLVCLTLIEGTKCQQVGALGKLPSLKRLSIINMHNVQDLDDECEMTIVFPSLEELLLVNLPNLARLLKIERRDIFPRLFKLVIQDCPKLDALPECVLRLTSLKYLGITGCPILSRRCKEEYWQKLDHIASKYI